MDKLNKRSNNLTIIKKINELVDYVNDMQNRHKIVAKLIKDFKDKK